MSISRFFPFQTTIFYILILILRGIFRSVGGARQRRPDTCGMAAFPPPRIDRPYELPTVSYESCVVHLRTIVISNYSSSLPGKFGQREIIILFREFYYIACSAAKLFDRIEHPGEVHDISHQHFLL